MRIAIPRQRLADSPHLQHAPAGPDVTNQPVGDIRTGGFVSGVIPAAISKKLLCDFSTVTPVCCLRWVGATPPAEFYSAPEPVHIWIGTLFKGHINTDRTIRAVVELK